MDGGDIYYLCTCHLCTHSLIHSAYLVLHVSQNLLHNYPHTCACLCVCLCVCARRQKKRLAGKAAHRRVILVEMDMGPLTDACARH